MSDLNWCTYCDNAIEGYSDSLYCSDECLRSDCLEHHPLLGYDYGELKNFPRPSSSSSSTTTTMTLEAPSAAPSAASSAATAAAISSPKINTNNNNNINWDDCSFTTVSSTVSTPSSSPSPSSPLYILSPPPSPSSSYQGIDKEDIYNLNYINHRTKTTMTTKHRTTPSIFYI